MPHSYALLGGFAIGARVALLWQHSANGKCQRVLVLALCLVIYIYDVMANPIVDVHACVHVRGHACTSRSTQPCIPPGSLNRVPASAGVKARMSPLPGGR